MKLVRLSPLLLLLLIFSCKKDPGLKPIVDEGTFTIGIQGMVGNQRFILNNEYLDKTQRRYKVSLLQYYISDITFIDEGGAEFRTNSIHMVDMKNQHNQLTSEPEKISVNVPVGNYSKVRFYVGVEPELNHSDPALYDRFHPLSMFNGTHWNWADGYRFVLLEGFTDSVINGTGNLTGTFVYHTGFDELYRAVEFDDQKIEIHKDEEKLFLVNLDINRVFASETDTINIFEDNFTHALPPKFDLARRLSDNFAKAFYQL